LGASEKAGGFEEFLIAYNLVRGTLKDLLFQAQENNGGTKSGKQTQFLLDKQKH